MRILLVCLALVLILGGWYMIYNNIAFGGSIPVGDDSPRWESGFITGHFFIYLGIISMVLVIHSFYIKPEDKRKKSKKQSASAKALPKPRKD